MMVWFECGARACLLIAAFALADSAGLAVTPPKPLCARVVIEGQVSAGAEWTAPLGQGWVFRVLPISPAGAGYSGWDLAMDRQQPAGFPDALLLATMPYNSINEREIGTTFGLRAQDAIGWNPRSFRFLSSTVDFREGRQLFQSLTEHGMAAKGPARDPNADSMARLLALQRRASTGEFRILDARIVPGIGDPAPYAQSWALASSRTPHHIESVPAGTSSPSGTLHWIRFAITLWLPGNWRVPDELHSARTTCPE